MVAVEDDAAFGHAGGDIGIHLDELLGAQPVQRRGGYGGINLLRRQLRHPVGRAHIGIHNRDAVAKPRQRLVRHGQQHGVGIDRNGLGQRKGIQNALRQRAGAATQIHKGEAGAHMVAQRLNHDVEAIFAKRDIGGLLLVPRVQQGSPVDGGWWGRGVHHFSLGLNPRTTYKMSIGHCVLR